MGNVRHTRRGAGGGRRRAAVVAAIVVVLAAGAASAQEPPPDLIDSTREQPSEVADTPLTPRPAAKTAWTQVGGAPFPAAEVIEGSPTAFDTDFYAVSMRNTKLGFAGGAKCRVETAPEDVEQCDEVSGNPAVGERVPVIYRFRQLKTGDRVWEPMDLGAGSEEPGYVGAIAWLDANTAVAVGGTGKYPRREECETEAPTCVDPAGEGRAWKYDADGGDDGEWREIDLTAQRAGGMGGLTALAFNPSWDPAWGIEGAAGGLAQIWEWKNGTFARRVDRHSGETRIRNPHLFRYRVRQIRPRSQGFVAVTSGCCGPTVAHDVPRLLSFERPAGDPFPVMGDSQPVKEGLWVVDAEQLDQLDPARRREWANQLLEDPRKACPGGLAEPACPVVGAAGPVPVPIGDEHDDTLDTGRRVTPNTESPLAGDSYYSVLGEPPTVLLTPGGSEMDGEPASQIVRRGPGGGAIRGELRVIPNVGSARLVDADGDGPGRTDLQWLSIGPVPAPDGIPDWGVGELRAARSRYGRQGLFVATHMRVPLRPDTVTQPPTSGEGLDSYEPTTEERVARFVSAHHQRSQSYSLNAIDMIEMNGSSTGQGWAVGDRGAIVGLNETRAGLDIPDPPPPALGARTTAALPDDAAYASPTPPSASPGIVPPLVSQPDVRDGEWRVRPVAPVPSAARIVMSRDGSEGWALQGTSEIGNQGIAHFDGRRWNLCRPDSAPTRGWPKADPACEGAAELLGSPVGSADASNYEPFPAARVPFEADADPSNDNEFEVVALARRPGESATIVRYRNGRWRREAVLPVQVFSPAAVAFASPGDGWILAGRPFSGDNGNGDNSYQFVHFDGERWTSCYTPSGLGGNDECDPENRLPQRGDQGAVTDLVGVAGRVYAVGYRKEFVRTPRVLTLTDDSMSVTRSQYPMVVFREPGKAWTKEVQEGEYDPANGLIGPQLDRLNENGEVDSLAVVRRPDGRYEGWATGVFGLSAVRMAWGRPTGNVPRRGSVELDDVLGFRSAASPLLRLDPGDPDWPLAGVEEAGVLREYGHWFDLRSYWGTRDVARTLGSQIAIEPSGDATSPAFMTQDTGRLFGWNRERGRWELMQTGRPPHSPRGHAKPEGFGSAVAADGRGGLFALADDYMFHFSDREPRAVFEEVPRPEALPARRITALAGERDGTVWAATNSDVVYRYRRQTGWDRARVPGWEPGRVVTAPAEANAIAVGEGGEGVVVGADGRIADFSGRSVQLDAAAGRPCDLAAVVAPCGTSRDLLAAAVAADGSALVGGRRLSLLWRPAGGEFRAVTRPDAAIAASITGIAMPAPDRAWLVTHTGLVYRGVMAAAGEWSWGLENLDENGDMVSAGGSLSAISVSADGRGYALGNDRMLERTGDGEWHPVELVAHSIAIPPGGGPGVVIGGDRGGIRTLIDGRFEIAREQEFGEGALGARVSAVALAPGTRDGEVEAWAVVDSQPVQRILHHASDREDPLMRPDERVRALPDAPAAREGELSVAVFGKSDCHTRTCMEMVGTTDYAEVLAGRVVEEIAARAREPGGPRFAVSTGDAADVAGYAGSQATESTVGASGEIPQESFDLDGGYGPEKLRRWSEFVGDRLEDEGVALFGAAGAGDLSDGFPCNGGGCESLRRSVKTGENLAWRQAMAGRPGPWGAAAAGSADGLRVVAVPDGEHAVRGENVEVAEPDDAGVARNAAEVPVGGASTHYAFDLVDGADRAVARVVVLDSSFGTLSQSDPHQQPAEPDGGQLAWLERVLCTGEGCTRAAGQPAIVVSNTPTYSYFPGLGLQAAADGALVESVLLRHKASAMVSGRLGWNGLYWATAPGLHYPCTGQRYTTEPPDGPGTCAAAQGSEDPGGQLSDGAGQLAGALRSAGAPPPPERAPATGTPLDELTGQGLLPVAVASGAGGKFGAPGAPDARDGFWHGYSIVRVAADGDPRETIVEQRPIYDHIAIEAQERTLRPGQRMTLRGYGRGPIANRTGPEPGPAQIDRIDSDAITHRYDLLLADPEKPWLPLEDPNGDYIPLPPQIATIDSETGLMRARRGAPERTHAIGLLSVGDKAASYPLTFEPRRSFAPQQAKLKLPPLARPARAPAAQPPLRAAEPLPPPPPPPPTAPASPLSAQTLQPPQPPQLPALPAAQPPPAPQPPAPPQIAPPPPPPAPPPVPTQPHPEPLALGAKLQAVSIIPSVNPPAPPPVNPAPPAGSAARKEAKQRQAATAKSEEKALNEAAENGGDLANGPVGPQDAPFVRRDRVQPGVSITPLERPEQASAWTRGALYGGGLAALAFALSVSWGRGRPKARPHAPAPSWARNRQR